MTLLHPYLSKRYVMSWHPFFGSAEPTTLAPFLVPSLFLCHVPSSLDPVAPLILITLFDFRSWVVPRGTRPGWPSRVGAGVMRRDSIPIESGFSVDGHDARSRIRRWLALVGCHHAYFPGPLGPESNAPLRLRQHGSIRAAPISDRRSSPSLWWGTGHRARQERCRWAITPAVSRPIRVEGCL